MRNSGRFPQEKPAATELLYPTLINYNLYIYKVHAGSFRVSVIHQTLTLTTTVQDLLVLLIPPFQFKSLKAIGPV